MEDEVMKIQAHNNEEFVFDLMSRPKPEVKKPFFDDFTLGILVGSILSAVVYLILTAMF